MFVGQTERLNQGPRKSGLGIKIAEHLRSSIAGINDCVHSRDILSCCFVGLAALPQPLELTMSASKPYRTGTVVPDTRGLTYFFAGTSIDARIAFAAAVDARHVAITCRLWNRSKHICFSDFACARILHIFNFRNNARLDKFLSQYRSCFFFSERASQAGKNGNITCKAYDDEKMTNSDC